jgi:hypothetical protein
MKQAQWVTALRWRVSDGHRRKGRCEERKDSPQSLLLYSSLPLSSSSFSAFLGAWKSTFVCRRGVLFEGLLPLELDVLAAIGILFDE